MNIHHTISKVYKIINLDGEIIDAVDIRVDKKVSHSLRKGGGFYVLFDLLEGKHFVTISHKKYETLSFWMDVENTEEIHPQVLCLHWKEAYVPKNRKRVTGVLATKQHVQEFYYCICTKKNMLKVLNDTPKGSQILKMKFSEKVLLDYRMAAVSSCQTIYMLKEYDFEKRGYQIDSPLEEEIELGENVYLLQKGVTDEQGKYHILVEEAAFDKENKVDVLLFYDNKREKVTIDRPMAFS